MSKPNIAENKRKKKKRYSKEAKLINYIKMLEKHSKILFFAQLAEAKVSLKGWNDA